MYRVLATFLRKRASGTSLCLTAFVLATIVRWSSTAPARELTSQVDVTIDSRGRAIWADHPWTVQELDARLATHAQKRPLHVRLHVERGVRFSKVKRFLKLCDAPHVSELSLGYAGTAKESPQECR